MRPKQRYILGNAAVAAGIVGISDVIMQWTEHGNIGKPFTWDSFDGSRTLNRFIIGGAVGGGIGYLRYNNLLAREASVPFYADEYITKLLLEENLKADPSVFSAFMERREEVKKWLTEKFSGYLCCPPIDSGSFRK